ncbi:IclR family transcriptional regulator [Domibacillus indicus]|uniref:IclR family transcriptional regulator n=1 Tax=Domibacillus indicus TaxID=1437523 RepID=UPI00203A7EF1|nr:IclR family transcriptional regulator [Domibacillus indicus]MCM3791031.1 IclR family transcriptional regulator [Domibacillus indicus]
MSEVIRKSVLLLHAMKPTEEREEWSATELSRDLGIPVQTVHRLLSSLEEQGLVYRSPETRKFRMGLLILQLGLAGKNNLSVRKQSVDIVQELVRKTKNPVFLTVPEGEEGVLIEYISPGTPKSKELTGTRFFLFEGAFNKVMLAFMKKQRQLKMFEMLSVTQESNKLKELEDELTIIQKEGWAVSFNEIQPKTACISAPIFNWENEVVASVSMMVWEEAFAEDTKGTNIKSIKKAAEEISSELGWIQNIRQVF